MYHFVKIREKVMSSYSDMTSPCYAVNELVKYQKTEKHDDKISN